ncbi:MAG: hypothetical protein ACE5R6_08870 [Candidatus Heimdallarchaeota archaeon]
MIQRENARSVEPQQLSQAHLKGLMGRGYWCVINVIAIRIHGQSKSITDTSIFVTHDKDVAKRC